MIFDQSIQQSTNSLIDQLTQRKMIPFERVIDWAAIITNEMNKKVIRYTVKVGDEVQKLIMIQLLLKAF